MLSIGLKIKNYFLSIPYDFEDLFNSIKIDYLIEVLFNMFNNYYNNGDIDEIKFKILTNLAIKENYIYYNGKLFQQINGITQGGPASNSLANLYLSYFESEIVNNSNCYLFRYIDDLIIFSRDINYIPIIDFYPNYLNLILTNNTTLKAHFLDLDIDIVDFQLHTKIYDKRNDFNFLINRLPNWNSNIHSSIFRNIIFNINFRAKNLIQNNFDRINFLKIFYLIAIQMDFPVDFLNKHLILPNLLTNPAHNIS
jgi:hypothetical protein